MFVGGWEEVGECGGLLPVVRLSAKVLVTEGLVEENTRVPVPGCMNVVTGSVGVWCGAVTTVALVERKNREGMWWQGSVSMFAMVVRVVA